MNNLNTNITIFRQLTHTTDGIWPDFPAVQAYSARTDGLWRDFPAARAFSCPGPDIWGKMIIFAILKVEIWHIMN